MSKLQRILLTAKLSGVRLAIYFNPFHWKFVPKIQTEKDAYADEMWLVGDFYKMIEFHFLFLYVCAWIDTGSKDDLLFRL